MGCYKIEAFAGMNRERKECLRKNDRGGMGRSSLFCFTSVRLERGKKRGQWIQ